MDYEKIIYCAITKKKHTILTEFTDCSGNFSQLIMQIMDEIIDQLTNEPEQYKAKFIYGKYIFHLIKDVNIYIIIMTKPSKTIKDDSIYFNLIFSINQELDKKIDKDKVKKMRPYSLVSYSEDLKKKINSFNNGEIKFANLLTNNQNYLTKFEELDDKKFNEFKQIPILSNEQVHSENNMTESKADITINSSYTIDSFNADILKNSCLGQVKTKDEYKNENFENEDVIAMRSIRDSTADEFLLKPRVKKHRRNYILLIFIILAVLVVLYFMLECLIGVNMGMNCKRRLGN